MVFSSNNSTYPERIILKKRYLDEVSFLDLFVLCKFLNYKSSLNKDLAKSGSSLKFSFSPYKNGFLFEVCLINTPLFGYKNVFKDDLKTAYNLFDLSCSVDDLSDSLFHDIKKESISDILRLYFSDNQSNYLSDSLIFSKKQNVIKQISLINLRDLKQDVIKIKSSQIGYTLTLNIPKNLSITDNCKFENDKFNISTNKFFGYDVFSFYNPLGSTNRNSSENCYYFNIEKIHDYESFIHAWQFSSLLTTCINRISSEKLGLNFNFKFRFNSNNLMSAYTSNNSFKYQELDKYIVNIKFTNEDYLLSIENLGKTKAKFLASPDWIIYIQSKLIEFGCDSLNINIKDDLEFPVSFKKLCDYDFNLITGVNFKHV